MGVEDSSSDQTKSDHTRLHVALTTVLLSEFSFKMPV